MKSVISSAVTSTGDVAINGVDGDAGFELDAEDDVERKRALPTPLLPSAAEREYHFASAHLSYKSWCGACVNGRGRDRPHLRQAGKRQLPTMCFDYMFLNKDGVFTRDEWILKGDTEGVKVLVAKEAVSQCVFAYTIPVKGVDEERYSVDCLVKSIEWMGWTRIALMSDNEPAIVKLLKESLKSLRVEGLEQASEEHSPEYDPRANGIAENTVGAIKGVLRTNVIALEERLGHRVPPDHPLMSWLVSYCAYMMTVRIRGTDGQTAFERIRVRPFTTKLPEFGECVRYKFNKRDTMKDGTLAAIFGKGIFLGVCGTTAQYIIFQGDSMVTARTVVRFPDSQKWRMAECAAVN